MGDNAALARRERCRRDAEQVGGALRPVSPAHHQARQRPEVASPDPPGLAPELIVSHDARAPVRAPVVSEWEANDGLVLRGYQQGEERFIEAVGVGTFSFSSKGPVLAAALETPDKLVRDVWLRSVLPLVVQARGTQVLHASAVRRDDGGIVALCGRATAGKSTLAAALARDLDVEIVADDALAFDVSDGVAHARPLPYRLRLRPASSEKLNLPRAGEETEAHPAGPFRQIIILAPDARAAMELRPLRPAEAFGALMPHAYCFSLEDGKSAVASTYSELCRGVNVSRLAFPRQLQRLEETLSVFRELVQ